MVDSSKLLVVVPARGGSKRLPRKNVAELAGRTLLEWTLNAALEAKLRCPIVVSTDDTEVFSIAKNYEKNGVIAHNRPPEFATDTSTTAEVILDALRLDCALGQKTTTVILLQPTSPLRESSDILEALKKYREHEEKRTVTSVCRTEHPASWIGKIDSNGLLQGINFKPVRSQDIEPDYRLNGAVYIIPAYIVKAKKQLFTESVVAVEMPIERSIDIDELSDLEMCRITIEQRAK